MTTGRASLCLHLRAVRQRVGHGPIFRAAATNRLRRKLEILKLDASKSRGQLFHDLQECQALMDIIAKGEDDK
jgi:hypothetical protein